MNAAARVIHQSSVFTGHWFAMRLSKIQSALLSVICLMLLSAIGIIYITNEYRGLLSDMERLQKQSHTLHMEWGQLLLEQASLVSPSRVEALASQHLGMHLPRQQVLLALHAK